ncbi:MAG: hypothetical protein IPL26_15470 [Leptospiraceae bacterium]|nr:hypothetical protein [Leptospiraceae bacterium]
MNFQTILLLFISFTFSVLGGFIGLYGKTIDERNLGWGCLGLFGISFFIFSYSAWRKSVFEKQILENAKFVSIEGGKRFNVEKRKLYIASIILFFLGGFLSYFLKINLMFTILTAVISGLGFFIFFGILFGFIAREYLVFEFDGIRMGYENYSYIIRWDNVRKISSDEWNHNMAVFITLLNPEDITRYLFVKKGRRDSTIKTIHKKISWNLSMTSHHILILPERFGLDSGYFYRMLESYLKFPERRQELKNNQKLGI